MSNLFLNMSNIHSYITQSSTSEIKFYVKRSRIEIQSNSFFWLGVKLRNRIPSHTTNLPESFQEFSAIILLLFDIVEMEDDCIEIPLIIKKSSCIDTLVKGLDISFFCLYAMYFQ